MSAADETASAAAEKPSQRHGSREVTVSERPMSTAARNASPSAYNMRMKSRSIFSRPDSRSHLAHDLRIGVETRRRVYYRDNAPGT